MRLRSMSLAAALIAASAVAPQASQSNYPLLPGPRGRRRSGPAVIPPNEELEARLAEATSRAERRRVQKAIAKREKKAKR